MWKGSTWTKREEGTKDSKEYFDYVIGVSAAIAYGINFLNNYLKEPIIFDYYKKKEDLC